MDYYCFCVDVNVLYVKKIFSIYVHSQTFKGFLFDNLSFTDKGKVFRIVYSLCESNGHKKASYFLRVMAIYWHS